MQKNERTTFTVANWRFFTVANTNSIPQFLSASIILSSPCIYSYMLKASREAVRNMRNYAERHNTIGLIQQKLLMAISRSRWTMRRQITWWHLSERKKFYFLVCYLPTPSVSRQYGVNNRKINERGAVGGMRRGRGGLEHEPPRWGAGN
jgi:hypothetical protein